MKKLLIIVLSLISITTNGQSLFSTKFDNCETGQFFLEGSMIFSKCNLNDYLNILTQQIEKENLVKIKGQVTLQIVVDKQGKPCCQSIKNELNGKGKKIDFKKTDTNINWSNSKIDASIG
ncbi:MAG: hypothetical protein ACERKD_24425 [Prolixibacteraceae bacterium]